MTKRTWTLLGIFLVTAVIGLIVLSSDSTVREEPMPQETGTPVPLATKAVQSKTEGTAEQTKLYTQLVAEYRDRRIQFDAMCQAIPNNVTYKNGTKIMLDNRSGDARYITVGTTKYYLAGYGYKIVTLSGSNLPKTLLLSCGGAVNVGQILLQN